MIWFAVHRLAGAGWPDDEHDAHAVHIHVLKERRPGARLEDVQVFGIEVFRVRMSDMRSEHGGEPRMMVLCQPQREDIELLIAGEHRIERREVAKRLLHHLRARIDKDPMHSWDVSRGAVPALRPASSRRRENSPCAFLSSERMTSLRSSTLAVGGLRACAGFERSGIASAHHAGQHTDFEKRDELLLCVDLAARSGRGL